MCVCVCGHCGEILTSIVYSFDIPVPVEIVQDPIETTHFAGGNITLSCTASGVPLPTIIWLKDGEELVEDARVSYANTTILDTPNQGQVLSVLSFFDLQLTDDADYACRATNPGAYDNSFTVTSNSSHLNVQRKQMLGGHYCLHNFLKC